MNELIEEKLKLLPDLPGVYRMYDSSGTVIYVGKAINLKNRVRQYFHSSKNHTPKVRAMVSHIADFETIIVANETEALSLESNLIKQYKPHYNILLKDDKHFPYVRIDMHKDFPRIEIVRKLKNDGARYIGPFLSASLLKDSMNIVTEHFPLRPCKKDLSKAIARGERPCLLAHVGKCCAPCSGTVTPEAYKSTLQEVIHFLNGDTHFVLSMLEEKMLDAASREQFEKAAHYRDTIRSIRKMNDKQVVISTAESNLDVFSLARWNGDIMVFAMFIRKGKVIGTEKFRMDASEYETDEEILSAFLKQFYAEITQFPAEIAINLAPEGMEAISLWLNELSGRRIHLHVPYRGDKKKLTEMAYNNCMEAMKKEETIRNRAYEKGTGALAELSILLGLDAIPDRLECFDNSHLMGRDTVASMVVFTDAQPDRKAYRRFRIKTDAGGDDLAAMREVLTRRFSDYLSSKPGFDILPDLLVVDGGKTQLDVALDVLTELGLSHIPVIGLAEQNELIHTPWSDEPIRLERASAPLHVLERIRDEAHRFAIQYHRSVRQKNALYSILDSIDGIGPTRKKALFDKYLTIESIKAASIDDLANTGRMNRPAAEAVYTYFHPNGE